jgi:hypothetical protein
MDRRGCLKSTKIELWWSAVTFLSKKEFSMMQKNWKSKKEKLRRLLLALLARIVNPGERN